FAPSGPVVNPSTSSSYTVTGFSAQGCASQPVSINVSVAPLPAITVSSITICEGMQHTLTPSGGVSYTYSGGSAIVTPSITTNYTVSGMGANGCTNNAVATVSVNPNPIVSVAGPTNICAGTPVTYTASGGAAYSWFPGPLNGTVVTLTPST